MPSVKPVCIFIRMAHKARFRPSREQGIPSDGSLANHHRQWNLRRSDPWWSAGGGSVSHVSHHIKKIVVGQRTASQVWSEEAPKVWVPLVARMPLLICLVIARKGVTIDASALCAGRRICCCGCTIAGCWSTASLFVDWKGEQQVFHHTASLCRSFYQKTWKNSSGSKVCGTYAETKRQPKSECYRKQATGQLFLTENYPNCQLERASCKHSATLERHRLFRNNSLIKKSCETITPGCCIE